MEKEYLSKKEVESYLGCSRRIVDKLLWQEDFKNVYTIIGRSYFFNKKLLDEYMQEKIRIE